MHLSKQRYFCLSIRNKQYVEKHRTWLQSNGYKPGQPFQYDEYMIHIPYVCSDDETEKIMKYVAKCVADKTI